jgi:hypothetical protein
MEGWRDGGMERWRDGAVEGCLCKMLRQNDEFIARLDACLLLLLLNEPQLLPLL